MAAWLSPRACVPHTCADTPPLERARQLLTPSPRGADAADATDAANDNGNSGGGAAAAHSEEERREDDAADAAAAAAAAAVASDVAAAAHEDAWEDAVASKAATLHAVSPSPPAAAFALFEELPAEALAEMPQPLPTGKPLRATAQQPAAGAAAAAANGSAAAVAAPAGANGARDDVSSYMRVFGNPLWERTRSDTARNGDDDDDDDEESQALGGHLTHEDADADADAVDADAVEAEAEAEAAAELTEDAMGHHTHHHHAARAHEEEVHAAHEAPVGAPQPPPAAPRAVRAAVKAPAARKDAAPLQQRSAAPPPPSYFAAHEQMQRHLDEEAHAAAVAAAEAAAMTAAAEAALDGIYSPKDEALLTRALAGAADDDVSNEAADAEAEAAAARGSAVLAADAALRGAAGTSAAALGRTAATRAAAASSTRAASVPIEMSAELPVCFELPLHVRFGERVALVGSGEALGNWRLSHSLPLSWSAGDVWRSTPVLLPADGTFAYKYVVLSGGGAADATWQRGANNVLMMCAEDAPAVRVCDSWKGDPTQARTHAGPPGTPPMAPAERLAAVAGARASAARRERARADAAMRALAAERLAVRALRAEATLAAGVRAQLRALLDAERRRGDALAAHLAGVMGKMQAFKSQAWLR